MKLNFWKRRMNFVDVPNKEVQLFRAALQWKVLRQCLSQLKHHHLQCKKWSYMPLMKTPVITDLFFLLRLIWVNFWFNLKHFRAFQVSKWNSAKNINTLNLKSVFAKSCLLVFSASFFATQLLCNKCHFT